MSILDVDLEEFPDSDVIPSGQYKVRIDKVDGPLQDKNDDQYLKFVYTVVEGPYTNRQLFDNYVSLSPQAARASQIKKILKACAFAGGKLRTTDEIVGLEMVVVVKVKEDPEYGEQNRISVYLDLSGASEMTAAGPVGKRLKK